MPTLKIPAGKVTEAPEPPTPTIDWSQTKVTAIFSTNVFNDQISAARWIGAELSVNVNISGIEEDERRGWLDGIHGRLTEVCQELVDASAERFVRENKMEGWKK